MTPDPDPLCLGTTPGLPLSPKGPKKSLNGLSSISGNPETCFPFTTVLICTTAGDAFAAAFSKSTPGSVVRPSVYFTLLTMEGDGEEVVYSVFSFFDSLYRAYPKAPAETAAAPSARATKVCFSFIDFKFENKPPTGFCSNSVENCKSGVKELGICRIAVNRCGIFGWRDNPCQVSMH